MEQKELNEILEKHTKWLKSEEVGERADLSYTNLSYTNLRDTNLSYTNLRGANLRGANLHGANLHGADLDYSCFPLWCGGLKVHIDDRIAIQLLYHTVQNALFSKNVSERVKKILSAPDLIALANEFHRVEECGKIEVE